MSRRNQQQQYGTGKPSVAFHMIRHAESNNNKVYSDAKTRFRFGASDFDNNGFQQYVDTHRKADPHLSPLGVRQADALADEYLNPALFEHQASSPIRIFCSPMLRTLLTIRPTLERLILSSSSRHDNGHDNGVTSGRKHQQKIRMIIVSYYHEIEGCHTKGQPEPGMNPNEIRECLFRHIIDNEQLQISQCDINEVVTLEFVGFDRPDDGWYASGTGHESRVDAEARAAKYCLWLSEYLDSIMYNDNDNNNNNNNDNDNEYDPADTATNDDLFDVGFLFPGEDLEDEHDRFRPRLRRRRTVLAIGHGDFMSVVLKRLVGGYVGCGRGGRLVEQSGLPHRTAFAHYNTGITELEYFGHSRFIVMTTNVTPHIPPERYRELRSGGTLRDGWAFTVPPIPEISVETEVISGKCDDNNDDENDRIHDHVQEQIAALKSLYLSSTSLSEEIVEMSDRSYVDDGKSIRFIVKRGFQVLAVATYSERNGQLTDVAIRPTAKTVADTLLEVIQRHALLPNEPHGDLLVRPRSAQHKEIFQRMGFSESEKFNKNCGEGTNARNQQQAIMILVL